jgi:hypothetical protein
MPKVVVAVPMMLNTRLLDELRARWSAHGALTAEHAQRPIVVSERSLRRTGNAGIDSRHPR